ncbi:MAG: BON domain-containing protein [Spirochaetota bacterium]
MASGDKIKDKVYWAIKNSDQLKPGNYVSVSLDKKGLFGKPKIVLTGRSPSESEQEKVMSIAREAAGDYELVNRMGITKSS